MPIKSGVRLSVMSVPVAACLEILAGHRHGIHHMFRVVPLFKLRMRPNAKFTCASK